MNAPVLPDQIAADAVLTGLRQQLNQIQRSVRLQLQTQLATLTGRNLGSLEHNAALAQSIQELLDGHGLRIRCHQCGQASILRVSPRKSMAGGAFVFDHTVQGRRTFHGGTACVPPMVLTTKPPRKKS